MWVGREEPPTLLQPLHPLEALADDKLVLKVTFALIAVHFLLTAIILKAKHSALNRDPLLAAYQLTLFLPVTLLALNGTVMWGLSQEHAKMGENSHSRLLGGSQPAFDLARFMLGFQLYDLAATAALPRLRHTMYILHHSATIITALIGASISPKYHSHDNFFFFT